VRMSFTFVSLPAELPNDQMVSRLSSFGLPTSARPACQFLGLQFYTRGRAGGKDVGAKVANPPEGFLKVRAPQYDAPQGAKLDEDAPSVTARQR
jgi:hypothetical protein